MFEIQCRHFVLLTELLLKFWQRPRKLLVILIMVTSLLSMNTLKAVADTGILTDSFVILNDSLASLCLEVKNEDINKGEIQAHACNGNPAQNWIMGSSASPHIKIGDTDRCLVTEDRIVKLGNCSSINLLNYDSTGQQIVQQKDFVNYCLAIGNTIDPSTSTVKMLKCTDPMTNKWYLEKLTASLKGGSLEDEKRGRVSINRELHTAKIKNGLLYLNNTLFSSVNPQNTKPIGCIINFNNGESWGTGIKYTTFYTIGIDGKIVLVNACGKVPLEFKDEKVKDENTYRIEKKEAMINHAVIANAVEVFGAGEIDVINGVITYIDNCSGHYKPNNNLLLNNINWLATKNAKGLPKSGLRLSMLEKIKQNGKRAGTGDCYSYVPPVQAKPYSQAP